MYPAGQRECHRAVEPPRGSAEILVNTLEPSPRMFPVERRLAFTRDARTHARPRILGRSRGPSDRLRFGNVHGERRDARAWRHAEWPRMNLVQQARVSSLTRNSTGQYALANPSLASLSRLRSYLLCKQGIRSVRVNGGRENPIDLSCSRGKLMVPSLESASEIHVAGGTFIPSLDGPAACVSHVSYMSHVRKLSWVRSIIGRSLISVEALGCVGHMLEKLRTEIEWRLVTLQWQCIICYKPIVTYIDSLQLELDI